MPFEKEIKSKPRLLTMPTTSAINMDSCQIMGVSLAGCRTSLYIPELKICFDAGFPFPFQMGTDIFFITHGHIDHAAAIPYIISQKKLNHQKRAQFYMPEELVEPLSEIIKLWERIEQHQYLYEFLPMVSNQRVDINNYFFVKSFKAHHRVPARGYTLFQSKKHLKKEFENLSKEALLELKNKGINLNQIDEFPLMTFSGDSQIEFLWEQEWIQHSRYLFIETTYIDDRKTVAQAREWGHIHLDELIQVLPQLHCEKIVLMHISSRYGDSEAKKIIASKIPDSFKDRVIFFEGR